MNNILTKCCARLFLCHDVYTVQPSEIPTEIPVMNASDKNSSIIKQNQSAATAVNRSWSCWSLRAHDD